MLSTDGGSGRQSSQRMDRQLERHRRLRSLSSHHFKRSCRHCVKGIESSRSERQHKAWGASPRIAINKKQTSPRSGRQRMMRKRCRPLRGLCRYWGFAILGLAPQALCCRSLRELYAVVRFASFMLSFASRALCCRSLHELYAVARFASFVSKLRPKGHRFC